MKVRARFEPRDLWVGVFWDRRVDGLHVFWCPLPMLVVHVHVPAHALERCEGCGEKHEPPHCLEWP
jgi:hypothetical protein